MENSIKPIVTNYCNGSEKKDSKKASNNTAVEEYNLPSQDSAAVQGMRNNLNITNGESKFLGTRKIFNHDAYFYKLPNGQNVILVPKKGTTVVKTYVNVGSTNEPDHLRGISHFIEHNLFNGSEGIESGEFFKRTAKIGAYTNASTGFSATDYIISSQLFDTDDLEEKIKLHANMLQYPKFEQSQIEKERGPVTSEISMYDDMPEKIAFNQCLKTLLGISSSSRDIIAGTINNINNMTRKDVVDYYNTWYTPDNMTTVITGEFNPNETLQLLSKYFKKQVTPNYANRKYEKFTPLEKTVRQDFYSPRAGMANIIIGFTGPENNAPVKESVALDAIQNMLCLGKTSRLNKELDKYNAFANIGSLRMSNKPDAPNAIFVEVCCPDDKTEEVLKEVYNQIYQLTTQPPTDEELKCFKKEAQSMGDRVEEMSQLLNYCIGESALNNDFERIFNFDYHNNSLQKEDVVNLAQKYLNLDKCSICVVHPEKKSAKVAFGAKIKKQPIEENEIQQGTLANNIEFSILDSNKSQNELVLRYDSPKNIKSKIGTSQILNKILDYGTQFKDQDTFDKLAEKNNIDLSIDYKNSGITAAFRAPKENMALGMQLLQEKLFAPEFSDENFQKAKDYVKNLIKCQEKNANQKLTKELLGTPLPEEVLKSIDNVTLNDVKKLYYQVLGNSQASVGLLADEANSNMLLNRLSAFPAVQPFDTKLKKKYTPVKENKLVTEVQKRNQAEIIQGFKFKRSQNDRDEAAVVLMNTILGGKSSSRLFSDLREKQKLAYGVHSRIRYIDDIGLCCLDIGTTTEDPDNHKQTPENIRKALDGFKKHIDMIKNTKCTQEELDEAKRFVKSEYLKNFELKEDALAGIFSAKKTPYGISGINNHCEVIDSITPEDIQKAANYIFNSKSVISIIGSEQAIEEAKKYPLNQ